MIPISIPSITEEEIELVNDAVKSTWVSSIGIYLEKISFKLLIAVKLPSFYFFWLL